MFSRLDQESPAASDQETPVADWSDAGMESEPPARQVFTRGRMAASTGVLVLVGLIAFAFIKQSATADQMNAKAVISEFASSKSAAISSQELFESDNFASRMADETMRSGGLPATQRGAVKAQLQGAFKTEFRNAVVDYRQGATNPVQARSLQMQLTPAKQDFVYDMISKMYDHRSQQLGGRILQSMASRPAGEADETTHRRILEEHGPLIRQYAKDMFPDGLSGAYDQNAPVYDQEDGIFGVTDRRLLPDRARNRIGPMRSDVVVGTRLSGIGLEIIQLILTGLNVASGPGFAVHIPKWAISLLAALSASLNVASCVVQFYDREKGIVNSTFQPAAMSDFGFTLGLQMPGWLKCALFSGISGLVTIISFVVDAVHAGTGKH